MDKDEVMKAGREYLDTYNHIQAELKKIDPGLQPKIKAEREKKLWDKYQDTQDARMEKVKAGRDYFKAARLREADPMKALIKKAWRAEDNRPGMGAVIVAMATMGAAAQLELARELNNPILSLQAVSNIKKMDLEPQVRMALEPAVAELTTGAVDMNKIRDHAQVEMSCVEIEAEINHKSGGDPVKRWGLGQRAEALKKIIATGELPKSERISVLTHPDPLERMKAGRKPDDA